MSYENARTTLITAAAATTSALHECVDPKAVEANDLFLADHSDGQWDNSFLLAEVGELQMYPELQNDPDIWQIDLQLQVGAERIGSESTTQTRGRLGKMMRDLFKSIVFNGASLGGDVYAIFPLGSFSLAGNTDRDRWVGYLPFRLVYTET